VIKLSIVNELKVSVAETFIQLWFCRTFRSMLLMLFLQDFLFCCCCCCCCCCCSVHAGLLGCLYCSYFKLVLLENVTDNPGHISWCVSSPDKHQSESGQTSKNNCCVEQVNKQGVILDYECFNSIGAEQEHLPYGPVKSLLSQESGSLKETMRQNY